MQSEETVAYSVLQRAEDPSLGLISGDLRQSHAEVASLAAQRADRKSVV